MVDFVFVVIKLFSLSPMV